MLPVRLIPSGYGPDDLSPSRSRFKNIPTHIDTLFVYGLPVNFMCVLKQLRYSDDERCMAKFGRCTQVEQISANFIN